MLYVYLSGQSETNNQNTNQMNTAQQILNQLGGNKFIAMTGATCISDNNTLIAKFKGSKVANIMYITHNPMDTYEVKICKFHGMNVKTISEISGAYSDMLKPFFESVTGLRVSL